MDILIDYPAWGRGLAGGVMIGVSALLLMASQGKIAGISGVVGGLLPAGQADQRGWRLRFLLGLLGGALLVQWMTGQPVTTAIPAPLGLMVLAGLVVGVGTRMGSGCTSGHGVWSGPALAAIAGGGHGVHGRGGGHRIRHAARGGSLR